MAVICFLVHHLDCLSSFEKVIVAKMAIAEPERFLNLAEMVPCFFQVRLALFTCLHQNTLHILISLRQHLHEVHTSHSFLVSILS